MRMPIMHDERTLTLAWLVLLGLTLLGGVVGNAGSPGLWVTVAVAAMMAFKGRVVIDHFLELGGAHPSIRRLVRFYAVALPVMLILTDLFGPQIARLTTL